jgi:hypothetical protein
MNAIYVLLFLGAFVPVAVITMLVLGALIHLTSLGKDALRAMSGTLKFTADASPSGPAAQLGHPPRAVPAEISVQGDVACAAA